MALLDKLYSFSTLKHFLVWDGEDGRNLSKLLLYSHNFVKFEIIPEIDFPKVHFGEYWVFCWMKKANLNKTKELLGWHHTFPSSDK